MQESLDNLGKINLTLISEKNELRNKLYEIFNNGLCYRELEREESIFFQKAALIFKDQEVYQILKKYEQLIFLICAIREVIENK